ncbi:MAG: ATP-binding protein [Planctomycetes bacterium]|nr:ATP-binding protein [Planctomycetota bacterium]
MQRTREIKSIKEHLRNNPVVALLGPRQCGKTTLAHQFSNKIASSSILFFDCEDHRDLAKLDNPMMALEAHKGIVIIDEIQRRPELFPTLRVLVDRYPEKRFLILGSASRDTIAQSSETLAGRISFIELGGFGLHDIKNRDYKKLWIRGSFPRSFLARSERQSVMWREDFVRTFLERDIPNLGFSIPPQMMRRFWMMLSHYHGQIFNASELGKSLGISDTTVKRYLDILSGTFVVRQLQPWFYNTKKRLVKRPKIFFRDSGLLHTLMAINNEGELNNHPKLGASWEGFALEQVLTQLNLREEESFFWGVHTGAELDLVFQRKGRLWGVEVKYSEAPTVTRAMKSALSELDLKHMWVIYPGKDTYSMDKKITAVGIQNLKDSIEKLKRSFPVKA